MSWASPSPRCPEGSTAKRGGASHALLVLAVAGCLGWAAWGQQATPGRLLGIVTDAYGIPLAGATVRLLPLGVHKQARLRHTALNGAFVFPNLAAGAYYVEAGRGRRISGRRKIEVAPARTAYLALPLLYMLGSLRVSAPGTRAPEDFGWLLRADDPVRPVLRWQEVQAAGVDGGARTNGFVSVMAGSSAVPQASPGTLATTFQVERQAWGDSELAVSGSLGTTPLGVAGTASRLSATFEPNGDRSPARLVVSLQQIPLPPVARAPDVQAVSINYADGVKIGDRLAVQYGAMFDTVSMLDSLHQLDPYFRVRWQAGPHAHWEYRFASAVPPVHFGPTYAQAADVAPRIALDNFAAHMERARHQELGYDDQFTPNDLFEVAVFSDRFTHTVVAGSGADSGDLASGDLLPDAFNNTFSADGGSYGGWGARVVIDHRLSDTMDAAVGWADGAVLAPHAGTLTRGQIAPLLDTARRQALTVKLAGVVPVTHTRLACSYRWLNGASATPVDPYDDSFDQSDSFANITLRQPLPKFAFGNRVEALMEFHNLLAQGYIPILSADGHLLYLIQAARSFRGGLSFSF